MSKVDQITGTHAPVRHPPCTTMSEALLPLLLPLLGGVLTLSLGSCCCGGGNGLSLLTGWNRMVAAVLGAASEAREDSACNGCYSHSPQETSAPLLLPPTLGRGCTCDGNVTLLSCQHSTHSRCEILSMLRALRQRERDGGDQRGARPLVECKEGD